MPQLGARQQTTIHIKLIPTAEQYIVEPSWYRPFKSLIKLPPHIFMLKFLYNALPNMYNKHKYSALNRRTDSQQEDLPLCPLCNQPLDSPSHLYCQYVHIQQYNNTVTIY